MDESTLKVWSVSEIHGGEVCAVLAMFSMKLYRFLLNQFFVSLVQLKANDSGWSNGKSYSTDVTRYSLNLVYLLSSDDIVCMNRVRF
jgi:hypothetical protein